jgi:hypothetical protein
LESCSHDWQWALSLLNAAAARLALEYEAVGKAKVFAALRPCLTAERGSIPYDRIAAALGLSESTARVNLHRLRKRFREVFLCLHSFTYSGPSFFRLGRKA